MEQAFPPQHHHHHQQQQQLPNPFGLDDERKNPASPVMKSSSRTSSVTTTTSQTSGASSNNLSSFGPSSANQPDSLLGDGNSRVSGASSGVGEQAQKKKKKKKDQKGQKKDKKKKKSSKSSSNKRKSSLGADQPASSLFGEGETSGILGNKPSDADSVWGETAQWNDEEWDNGPKMNDFVQSAAKPRRTSSMPPLSPKQALGPRRSSLDAHDVTAASPGGFIPQAPTSQAFALHRNGSAAPPSAQAGLGMFAAGPPPSAAMDMDSLDKSGDGFGIIHELQSFMDENMSVLTGDEMSFTNMSFSNKAQSMIAANHPPPLTNRRASTGAPVGGDSEQVSHQLIVNYMMAMGATRDTAEELAFSFASDKDKSQAAAAAAGPPPATGRYVQPAAFTLSSKLKEVERGHDTMQFQQQQQQLRRSSTDNNSNQPGGNSYPHKLQEVERGHNTMQFQQHQQQLRRSSANDQSSRASSSNQPSINSYPPTAHVTAADAAAAAKPVGCLKMVEATPVEALPVKDVESNLPIVYADTTPISFKHLVHERPVRRLMWIVFAVMFCGVIGLVVYFAVLKPDSSSDAGAGGPFGTIAPTISPSSSPTFISEDVQEAAAELSGWNALANPTSPQLRAVGWMSAIDEIDTGGYGGQRFAQRYALVVMYYSFQGEDWINQEQWLTPDMHECEWSGGIFCRFDESQTLSVTGFDATRNNLQGSIPMEIGILTSAETFRIPKNNVGGPIPDSIGKMTTLLVVDVSENAITGAIPATFDGARDLIHVDLSKNQLNAYVPDELYNLQFLRTLKLRSNQLSGTLSQALNNLSSLVTLDLRENQISGTMPISLDSIETLDVLLLDYNRITGSIPAISNSLTRKQTISLSHNQFSGNIALDSSYEYSNGPDDLKLTHVDLSHNLLSGPISPLFGYLPTFRHCDLSGNKFTGTFPSSVGWDSIEFLAVANNSLTGTVPVGYPTLTHLDFSGNQLTQGIPEVLCEYSQLEFLLLSRNLLASSIPDCIGDLPKIRDLELTTCGLTGTIPPALGRIPDLAILNLSDNSLTGTIPAEMGDFRTLKHLKLHQNALTGTIPAEFANIVGLQTLNLSENALTGTFPAELEVLGDLNILQLQGNSDLVGEIPAGLCDVSTLELLARDIGCGVVCECCSDAGDVCNV